MEEQASSSSSSSFGSSEEDNWILNCLQHELFIDKKCTPFAKVEREIIKLLAKKRRTHKENIRLAMLHEALKDYLIGMNDLKKQVESSQSYLNKMLSWWYTTDDGESKSSSGASVTWKKKRAHKKDECQ
jgi:hypothetical protein